MYTGIHIEDVHKNGDVIESATASWIYICQNLEFYNRPQSLNLSGNFAKLQRRKKYISIKWNAEKNTFNVPTSRFNITRFSINCCSCKFHRRLAYVSISLVTTKGKQSNYRPLVKKKKLYSTIMIMCFLHSTYRTFRRVWWRYAEMPLQTRKKVSICWLAHCNGHNIATAQTHQEWRKVHRSIPVPCSRSSIISIFFAFNLIKTPYLDAELNTKPYQHEFPPHFQTAFRI